jgi:molybdenum cofactor biosynthesis enzyme MoaA
MFIYNEKYVSKKQGCYYSCPWIEHGLVFFPYKLTMCCHCGHEGGGHTLIRNNFTGEKIDWDRVAKVREIFRRFHKKGKINTSCLGCAELKEDKWDGENYINNLYISHWTHCNSKCIYCYATQHKENFKVAKPYNSLPFIKEMYEKGILRAGGMISFGGGEPTLLEEFDDIVNYLLDNFFWGIRVHTSGIKYSEALARAVNEIRGYVVVSVDSGSKETYKKVKQVDCYDKVRDTIRKYALQTTFLGRFLVSAKYIIIPGINDNIEELDKWFDANYNDGLYTTVLDIEENWYLQNKDNIPKHIFELIDYAKKRAKKMRTNFELYERLNNMIKDREK